MASLEEPSNKAWRTSGEFVESAVLEAFVPSSMDFSIEEAFEAWDGEVSGEKQSVVPFVEQRQFLLLDEVAKVYVVLRSPTIGEKALKLYLSRLSITLEARAVGNVLVKGEGPTSQLSQVNELLSSETIKDSEDPIICAAETQSEEDPEPVQYIYVFWKVSIPLGRPRGKLQRLAIFFAPSASLRPAENVLTETTEDEYLPSEVAASVNLLQSFSNDPNLIKIKPRLSAIRMTKPPASAPLMKQLARPVKNAPRRLFRAAPAFLWRIRFSKFPGMADGDAMIASLDLEMAQFASSEVTIDKVNLQLASGTVHEMSANLPQRAGPGDQLTLIYRLAPNSNPGDVGFVNDSRDLTVIVSGTIHISEECKPKVKVKWKTTAEVQSSRPTSMSRLLSDSTSGADSSSMTPKPLGPDSLTMITGQLAEVEYTSKVSSGIVMTVTAPRRVTMGEVFRWQVFIVNRSDKVRRFAILAIPKRRAVEMRGIARRSSSIGGVGGENTKDILTNPVLDDNIVYSIQKSSMMEPTELLCLSPDVRIGALGPSACYTAELRFLALASGVLHLESLRFVDLATQMTSDLRDLPDIVVLEKVGGLVGPV